MGKNWIDTFSRLVERLVPDAITTSVILLIGVSIISLSIGNSVTATIDAYYKGLWMLLAFTMQMTLILALSLVLASTPAFKKSVLALSRIPRTTIQVVALAVLCAAFVSYLNWGLGLALGPMIAIHFCREAERKGIRVDFLFMLATLAGAGVGLAIRILRQRSAAHGDAGPFPPADHRNHDARFHDLVSGLDHSCHYLYPRGDRRGLSVHAEEDPAYFRIPGVRQTRRTAKASDGAPPEKPLVTLSFAQRLERSSIVVATLCFALICWLYYHFFTKKLSLDINSVNTIILLLGLLLHRNVARFTNALREAIVSSWPIVVMYHLYAGVAGLIQFTPVGEFLAGLADPISTNYSFPLLTALISTVVAVFIPTSGGQWLIQGFVTVRAAEAVGVTAQRGLLALSVGDHMGNLISPFWAVVGAGIARVDFRLLFGYRLIFAAIWFALGVAAFTFLPC